MSAPRIVTPELVGEARRLRLEGLKVPEVAERLGVSPSLIQRTTAGTPSIHQRRYTDGDRARAFELHRAGSSIASIAREIGCRPMTVAAWLDRPVRTVTA